MPALISRSRAGLAALAIALLAPSFAGAQIIIDGERLSPADSARLHDFARRWSGSLGIAVMQPLGEFRQNVANGFGVDGEAAFHLDRRGILSLRALMNFTGYGHEVKRSMISPTIGSRILVDVVTDNEIFSLGLGPRLQVPRGPVRPYIAASAGFANFSTSSHIRDEDYDHDGSEEHFETTQLSSTRFAWTGSGGVLIPVNWSKTTSVQIDAGATYHGGDKARYLRSGDIVDNPDGTISFTPRYTATRFMVYRLGVRVGL
jgi:hypothetical protein